MAARIRSTASGLVGSSMKNPKNRFGYASTAAATLASSPWLLAMRQARRTPNRSSSVTHWLASVTGSGARNVPAENRRKRMGRIKLFRLAQPGVEAVREEMDVCVINGQFAPRGLRHASAILSGDSKSARAETLPLD